MAPSTPALLAYHVRRLDRAGRRALVADLWRARGFEVWEADDRLEARRDGGALHLHVGNAAEAPPGAAVAVDLERRGSPPDGVRVVDDAALAEMLAYAVDREHTRRLCERHLGAPPAALAPPLSHRLRTHLDALRPAVPALVVLGTLGLILGLMAIAVPAVSSPPATVAEATPSSPAADAPGTATPVGSVNVPPAAYPASPGDLSNVSSLVEDVEPPGRVPPRR